MEHSSVHKIFMDSRAKFMLDKMSNLRKLNMLCDVVLKAEGREFPVHRIVLAACSDYFHAMFTNQMSEAEKSTVELHDVPASVVEVLLDFIYTQMLDVSVENVQELLPAACLFQLNGAKEACSEFLEKQLDPSNCLGFRSFAEKHHCGLLQKTAELYTFEYFDDVIQHEEFQSLCFADVEDLVKSDEIQVSSEESVFEAIISWVRHSPSTRESFLPQLLNFVRLPLLSVRYITDVIDEDPLIRQSLVCRDLVDVAKKYHLQPDLQPVMESNNTKPRTGCHDVSVVVRVRIFVGRDETRVDHFLMFDPKKSEWISMPKILQKHQHATVGAFLENKIYVIGGYDGTPTRLNSVECLDMSENDLGWLPIAPMHHRRGAASACAYQGMLYVCGGFDGTIRLTSMERYDPNFDEWSLLGSMNTGRQEASLLVVSRDIYCIGGYDGRNVLNSAEKYDMDSKRWTFIAPMCTKRCDFGVTVLYNTIYVCGGHNGTDTLDSVESYNVQTGRWCLISNMNIPRHNLGACVHKGKLYVAAGYNDNDDLLSSVDVYDQRTETWQLIETCLPEFGSGDTGLVAEHIE